jgi:hypothetical protein
MIYCFSDTENAKGIPSLFVGGNSRHIWANSPASVSYCRRRYCVVDTSYDSPFQWHYQYPAVLRVFHQPTPTPPSTRAPLATIYRQPDEALALTQQTKPLNSKPAGAFRWSYLPFPLLPNPRIQHPLSRSTTGSFLRSDHETGHSWRMVSILKAEWGSIFWTIVERCHAADDANCHF